MSLLQDGHQAEVTARQQGARALIRPAVMKCIDEISIIIIIVTADFMLIRTSSLISIRRLDPLLL